MEAHWSWKNTSFKTDRFILFLWTKGVFERGIFELNATFGLWSAVYEAGGRAGYREAAIIARIMVNLFLALQIMNLLYLPFTLPAISDFQPLFNLILSFYTLAAS